METDKIIDCWKLVRVIAEIQIFEASQNEDQIRRELLNCIGDYLKLDIPLDMVNENEIKNLPAIIRSIPKVVLDDLEIRSLTPDELIEFSLTYIKTVPFSELKNYIAIRIE